MAHESTGGDRESRAQPNESEAGAVRGAGARTAPVHSLAERLFNARKLDDVPRWLSDGDPLSLYPRCAELVWSRGFLLDVDRVHVRCLALIAHQATANERPPALQPWLDERINETIAALHEEDVDAVRRALPPQPPDDHHWLFVEEALGLEPLNARRAATAYNSLAAPVRAACRALVFEGREIDACERAGLGAREQLLEHVRIGLRALLHGEPHAFDAGNARMDGGA